MDSGSLYDYVEWHISWDPNNKAQYLSVLNILQSKYYDLQIIQGWKSSENEHKWKHLEVKPGIGICLACNLSIWAKKEKDAALSKSSFPFVPIPEKPIQLQRPARISYVLEKLAEKSRLALV